MAKAKVTIPKNWIPAKVRRNSRGQVQLLINPKPGSKFAKCVADVKKKGGAYDAQAVCAAAGRKKYGKKKFAKMAAAGRKRRKKS